MQETLVQYMGREDSLEKVITSHCNIFEWRMPWTKKPGGQQFMALQRVRHNWAVIFISSFKRKRNCPQFSLNVHFSMRWYLFSPCYKRDTVTSQLFMHLTIFSCVPFYTCYIMVCYYLSKPPPNTTSSMKQYRQNGLFPASAHTEKKMLSLNLCS